MAFQCEFHFQSRSKHNLQLSKFSFHTLFLVNLTILVPKNIKMIILCVELHLKFTIYGIFLLAKQNLHDNNFPDIPSCQPIKLIHYHLLLMSDPLLIYSVSKNRMHGDSCLIGEKNSTKHMFNSTNMYYFIKSVQFQKF